MIKYYAIALFFIMSVSSLFASDILTDFQEENRIEEKKVGLSPEAVKKAEALSFFANALLSAKADQKLSEEVYEKLIKVVEDDPSAEIPLSFFVLDWENTPKFKKYAEKLSDIAEKNPSALKLNIVAASLLIKAEKFKKAIKILEGTFKTVDLSDPKKKEEIINIAIILEQLYRKEGNFDKGDELFEDIFDEPQFKNNIKIIEAALAFYHTAVGKSSDKSFLWFDSPKEKYKEKMEKYLKVAECLSEKKHFSPNELNFLIDFYIRNKQELKAKNLLLQNILHNPDDLKSKILLAALYGSLDEFSNSYRLWSMIIKKNKLQPHIYGEFGRAAFRSGHYKEAADAFEWYLINFPESESALYQLGISYFEMGMYRKAISKLNKISNLPEADFFISMIYRKLGEYNDAAAALEKAEINALKQKREEFLTKDFYLTFAYLYDKAGKLESAERCLRTILSKHPKDPEALNFLGYMWSEHNVHLDEAEKFIAAALETDKGNPAYLDSMSWVNYKKGNFKEALSYIEKALALEGEIPDAVIAEHAGDIYLAMGEREKALKYWKLAASIYNEDINLPSIKEKIKKYGTAAKEKKK